MNYTQKLLSTSLVLSSVACAVTQPQTSWNANAVPAKNNIYVFEADANGFNTKTIFYDNGSEVVAFDAQFTPALAQQALDFLKSKTAHPLRYLVVTHPNPDKFNGIKTFQANGVKVIASQSTAAAMPGVHAYKKNYFVNVAHMFSEAQYPALGQVDATFSGHEALTLSDGEIIQLRELAKPGVSTTQTVAWIPTANALIVGDLVHHKAHAWLEGGIVNGNPTPTLASWIADLEEITTLYGASHPVVYGGRGEAVALQESIPQQISYLRAADGIVADYVKALGARRDELNGAKSAEHAAALQKRFEAAFPDYALSYMILYGVYGLALTK